MMSMQSILCNHPFNHLLRIVSCPDPWIRRTDLQQGLEQRFASCWRILSDDGLRELIWHQLEITRPAMPMLVASHLVPAGTTGSLSSGKAHGPKDWRFASSPMAASGGARRVFGACPVGESSQPLWGMRVATLLTLPMRTEFQPIVFYFFGGFTCFSSWIKLWVINSYPLVI